MQNVIGRSRTQFVVRFRESSEAKVRVSSEVIQEVLGSNKVNSDVFLADGTPAREISTLSCPLCHRKVDART